MRLRYDVAARSALMDGIDQVADAVKVTLGPRGRNVMLALGTGDVMVTNDGVTIANEIELEPIFERQGARLVREVASKTNEVAGDGTTTATLLAQAIVRHGLRNVAAGADPLALRRGIELAVQQAGHHVRAIQAVPITDPEQIARVATIAAGERAVGECIGQAFVGAGFDAVLRVEHRDTPGLELEFVEGMEFQGSYVSPHFITDPARREAVLENPYILIGASRFERAHEILPILEQVIPTGRPLLVLCEEILGEALGTLILNKTQGAISVVAVPHPEFVQRERAAFNEDLAILTGGIPVSKDLGVTPQNMRLVHLGEAERVVVDPRSTTIVGGAGDPEAIANRVRTIKHELDSNPHLTDWDRDKRRERMARLGGRVAVIRVGAETETEVYERRLRIEDAIRATRASIREGVVAGGGAALLHAREAIDTSTLIGDEVTGAEIIRQAVEEPLRQIAINAGIEPSTAVADVASRPAGEGLNAATGEILDLFDAGIVDPALVTRSALTNAASIAKNVLTTMCVVTDPDNEDLTTAARKENDYHNTILHRPPRELVYGAEARAQLQAGVDAVADVVKVTLGPKGRNVLVMTEQGVTITNDGATIAAEIELADRFARPGARLLRQVAASTNEVAGDGTTTATLLAQALVRHGLRNVAAGADPMRLRAGIELAVEQVIARLRTMAVPITEREEVARVATISSGDPQLGQLIAEAIEMAGNDGELSIQNGQTMQVELELSEGARFIGGMLHGDMATDEGGHEAVLEYPYILLVDHKLDTGEQLLPAMNLVAPTGHPLLVIADMVEAEAIQTLLTNKQRGILTSVAVPAPDFGERRQRVLEDLALLTGGFPVAADLGLSLPNVQLAHLGRARKVVVDRQSTTIIEGQGAPEGIRMRIDQIRDEMNERGITHFDKGKLQERLGRLIGGVAVIKVGAATETEQRERRHRVEDAVQAARAARTEGVLTGGGSALLHARDAIDPSGLDADTTTGAEIVRRTLEEPLRQIARNAGIEPSTAVATTGALPITHGLDAATGEYTNLVEEGIIDPAMVTRSALANAASIAKTILTTECIVSGPAAMSPEGAIKAGIDQ